MAKAQKRAADHLRVRRSLGEHLENARNIGDAESGQSGVLLSVIPLGPHHHDCVHVTGSTDSIDCIENQLCQRARLGRKDQRLVKTIVKSSFAGSRETEDKNRCKSDHRSSATAPANYFEVEVLFWVCACWLHIGGKLLGRTPRCP